MGLLDFVRKVPFIGDAIGAVSSLIGGSKERKDQMAMASANIAFQKEFAKHGISWRVADAREAGISPLVALGAQTHSFSPVYMPGSDRGIAKAGQDIGRAINAYLDRDSKLLRKLQILKENEILRGLKIDNDKKEIQPIQSPDNLGSLGVVGDIPNVSVTRIGDYDLSKGDVVYNPKVATSSMKVGIESGILPLKAFRIDEKGYLWLMPTQEVAEILESSWYDNAKMFLDRGKWAVMANSHYFNHKLPQARKHRDFLRSIRPKKPGPLWEYRYNPRMGFRLVRMQNKSDSWFYEDRHGGYKN